MFVFKIQEASLSELSFIISEIVTDPFFFFFFFKQFKNILDVPKNNFWVAWLF